MDAQLSRQFSAYVDSSGRSGNTFPRFLKRGLLRLRIWCHRKVNGSAHPPRPVAVGPEIAIAQRLWAEVVHRGNSELLYNPVNGEAYAVLPDPVHPVYIFLEKRRFRIVNTVVGYDVELDYPSEMWAGALFNREVHRRRSAFKEAALRNVVGSLQHLEKRLSHTRFNQPEPLEEAPLHGPPHDYDR